MTFFDKFVICKYSKPDLAIFGASMAGSCVGFLLHNRYKASVFMGNIGSLALGGALAAMAACTGMFFPLLISSGFFIVESLSVIIQVCPMLIMLPYISLIYFFLCKAHSLICSNQRHSCLFPNEFYTPSTFQVHGQKDVMLVLCIVIGVVGDSVSWVVGSSHVLN